MKAATCQSHFEINLLLHSSKQVLFTSAYIRSNAVSPCPNMVRIWDTYDKHIATCQGDGVSSKNIQILNGLNMLNEVP